MEELKKLVKLVEEQGKGAAGALLNLADNTSLETLLYTLVRDHSDLREQDALEKLYGKGEKSNAFKMLKSRVKKKLYYQLHFLDFDSAISYSKVLKEEVKCNELLNEALILDGADVVDLREKRALQALKVAKAAELSSHIVRALEILQLNYSFRVFDRTKFYEITQEVQKYRELSIIEANAKDLFHSIMVEMRAGVKNRIQRSNFIVQGAEELYTLWQQTNSSPIYSYYYISKTAALEVTGNIEDHIKHLNSSAELFKDGKISLIYFFDHRNKYSLTYAYLKNKQFSEGIILAEELKQELNSARFNWFAHMENYFMLATHSKDYPKAKEILIEVFSNGNQKRNPQVAQERWYLYHEFYTLIISENLGYTLNYKPSIITQDKHGYNVWYLILQFLKVLQTRDIELIERDTERLRKYSFKHYGSKSDPRTRLFLKLLLIAGQEHQNVQSCKRKSRYLLSRLEETPVAGDAFAEVEIIPYEHLWAWVLNAIQ